MSKYIFRDPVGSPLVNDTWLVNAVECKGPYRPANVTYDGKASGTGVIGTQGEQAPLIFTLTGKILHRSQFVMFWRYRNLKNSFYFTDEEGQQYEVTMTGFEPDKERVALNTADNSMPRHRYQYTMTLQVLRIISGDLMGVPV